jgi:hypothetical protein
VEQLDDARYGVRVAEGPMTAQPAQPRRIVRRAVGLFVVLLLTGGWLFLACGDEWKSSVVTFEFAEADEHRVRITGAFGPECVKLERREVVNPDYRWLALGKDCTWPRVAGGDGWLAGGQAAQVHSLRHNRMMPDWILFGIVPAAAAEVEITLAGGATHRIITREAGRGAHRIYAQHLPGVGDKIEVVRLRLRDGQGGELRVY